VGGWWGWGVPGAAAIGSVRRVTDNQLAIDSSLPLDAVPLPRWFQSVHLITDAGRDRRSRGRGGVGGVLVGFSLVGL